MDTSVSKAKPAVSAHQGYRRDVDGLRAIAVLAVVVFHLNSQWLPGGFAGVDIFFVISGFLITTNIATDYNNGNFSISGFYRRRLKRILPALSVVVLVTVLFGIFVLLPEDVERLSKSAMASMFFVANIFFYQTIDTSYFADSVNTLPLLHIWSLGVEEQFYLVWPVLLGVLISRLGRVQLLSTLVLVALTSFVFAQLLLPSDPSGAFYRLAPRVGELLVGAIVYYLVQFQWRLGVAALNVIGFVGLAAIVFSLGFIGEDGGFPGFRALPVTAGTALVIFAGSIGTPWVRVGLGTAPLVGVGLISYSLYLWHWPLLAYARYAFGQISTELAMVLLVAIFVLAVASYFLVEKRTRFVTWGTPRVVAVYFLVPVIIVTGLSMWLLATSGFGPYGNKYADRLKTITSQTAAAGGFDYVCQAFQAYNELLDIKRCIINGSEEPQMLLWGDSNAAHYVGVLGAFAKKAGFAFRSIAVTGCPPLLYFDDSIVAPHRREACRQSLDLISDRLSRYRTIVLGGAWGAYNGPTFIEDVERTIKSLVENGHTVIVLGQVPKIPGFDRNCERKALKLTFLDCRERVESIPEHIFPTNVRLKAFVDKFRQAHYFEVSDVICPSSLCSAYLGRDPVYYDPGHLSLTGSWKVGRQYAKLIGVPDFFVGDRGSAGGPGQPD